METRKMTTPSHRDGYRTAHAISVEFTISASIVDFTKSIVFLTLPFYHNY